MVKISIWHHYTLNQFSKEIHKKDLLFDDLIEEIVVDEDYWVFKLGNFKCLYASQKINALPISLINPLQEPSSFSKVNLGNKVFYKLLKYNTRKIKAEKTMLPYDFFNKFSDLEHSNQLHYRLYKALNLCGYFTRINARVASESEFGKNGVTKTLKYLTNKTRIITPASYPALLRGLPTTKVLNITEPKEFEGFDTFLEQVGDKDTHFENPKLESKGHQTHNEYDISKLSVLLTYNTLNYYRDRQQENKFFDNMFRYNIQSRYLPFMFRGFIKHIEKQDLNDEVYDELLEWLRNFYYYEENWEKYLHNYGVDLSKLKWGIRYKESFEQIIKFIDFISFDEKDFYNMVDELVKCHIAYERMVNGNSITIYDSIMPKKAEPIEDFEHIEPEIIEIEDSENQSRTFTKSESVVGFSETHPNANSGVSPLFFPQHPPQTQEKGSGLSSLVVNSKGFSPIFQNPLEFIKAKNNKGEISLDEFLDNYTEEDLNKLLKNADVFMPRNNLIKVLE
mgnify:CR=1 FL=1